MQRGGRLPSERALADAVAVSRGVVVAAYDELVADGVIERRPGSGTFVAGSPAEGLPPGREGSALVGRLVGEGVDQGNESTVIDLSISVLHDVDWLPDVSVGSCGTRRRRHRQPLGLACAAGARGGRISPTVGSPTSIDQVVITTGAQQGISIAAGCWVRPGDVVVVDDPTYPGALSAFAAAGAVVRPVRVDRDGIVLAELERALDDRPALVYLQSGPHSPTGFRMSAHRRQVVARWLADRRIPLVEDLALTSLDWSEAGSGRGASGPIAAHIPEHPAAVVGSFSQALLGRACASASSGLPPRWPLGSCG